ncbi:hypothetical protein TUM4249_16240 [Shewanella sp. KT0246]|nr:hypothetical protein TUM4249_16240 [Shewanella sp. KT0246]
MASVSGMATAVKSLSLKSELAFAVFFACDVLLQPEMMEKENKKINKYKLWINNLASAEDPLKINIVLSFFCNIFMLQLMPLLSIDASAKNETLKRYKTYLTNKSNYRCFLKNEDKTSNFYDRNY